MIPRYSDPRMAALFSDEARLGIWLEVELLAAEAWAAIGVLPASEVAKLRERAPLPTPELVEKVRERE